MIMMRSAALAFCREAPGKDMQNLIVYRDEVVDMSLRCKLQYILYWNMNFAQAEKCEVIA